MLALPLVEALARVAQVTVASPPWGQALYGRLATVVDRGVVPDDAEAGVLVKPAFRALWEARKLPRRIGWPTDHRRLGLTDVVPLRAVHRVEQIADLGGPLDIVIDGLPTFPVDVVSSPGVVMLPLSASGRTVEWRGYRLLADALVDRGHPVHFAAGPGECEALAAVAGPHPCLPPMSVGALGSVLAAADAVVGNDSGLTHLAVAARRGRQRRTEQVVGIAGSTCPSRTGAPGATWVMGPRPACAPCFSKHCPTAVECLDLPHTRVLEAICGVLDGRQR